MGDTCDMALPSLRDPAVVRQHLADWLSSRLDCKVTIPRLHRSGSPGFGNETIAVTARWDDGDGVSDHELAVRVQLTAHALFPESRFSTQHRVMTALGLRPGLRVPRVRWHEEDPAHLGAPFLVMDRVEGQAPPDDPPYTLEGWLRSSSAPIQRAVWEKGVDAMAAIHRVDHQLVGLGDLDPCPDGRSRLAHRIDQWAEMLRTASPGERQGVPEAGLAWLRENRPPDIDDPTLCWGDSRLANQLFVGLDEPETVRVSAVLDWEMVHVGDPLLDLGWFTWSDHALSIGLDVPRLRGLPSYRATAERWEQATGRSARHLRWAEVLAGVGHAIVMLRLATVLKETEGAPESDFGRPAVASVALERTLADLGVHPSDVE